MSRFLVRLVTILLCIVTAIYFMRAFESRDMPDLRAEHRIHFENEFSASIESKTDWREYLRIEDDLAAELDRKIHAERPTGNPVDRYSRNSLTSPDRYDGNWNHSYELAAAAPVGVAVLLHGLTDSPYSLLSTAEALAGAGYNVVVPRMPGHGFAVGGLKQVRSDDWVAAVRIAVRHAMNLPASDRSLMIAGYSNGGLLAIDYAQQCADRGLPCPDRLVLISPAITVSRYASIANLHRALSWIPYFEKFAWLSILPELDSFKFTSFPKRAGWEIHEVSRRVLGKLRDPALVDLLPPILTFQSIVDGTVGSTAVTEMLYRNLPQNGSKLVVYDINRYAMAVYLSSNVPADALASLTSRAPLAYDVTVITNTDSRGPEVDVMTLPAGTSEPQTVRTAMRWPNDFYSLSHIALPFRPDDPVYGDGSMRVAGERSIILGAMSPRGEIGVLELPSSYFLRARHNPFHRFQTREIIRWLTTDL